MPKKHLNPVLTVENYGPIATARLQLQPFTVLTGPVSAGKSALLSALRHADRAIRARPHTAVGAMAPIPTHPKTRLHMRGPVPAPPGRVRTQALPVHDPQAPNPLAGGAAAYGALGYSIIDFTQNPQKNLTNIQRRIRHRKGPGKIGPATRTTPSPTPWKPPWTKP